MTNKQTSISSEVIREYDILCKIQLPYHKNKNMPSKVSTYQFYKKMKENKLNIDKSDASQDKLQSKHTKGGNTEYTTTLFFG